MSTSPTQIPAPATAEFPIVQAPPAARTPRRAALAVPRWSTLLGYLGLAPVLALSAVLNTNKLSQNGFANVFYSAGVRSMLDSLHNFLFASFDPGGLITIDKPPLGLWVQVVSAKLFGYSPLSLLLPEAIAGVLSVLVLYLAVRRSFGTLAALAAALALAVFPSFVAVSRDNNVDALLILLMTLACLAALRAIRSGHWRSLLTCAVLVGLAFNTKTLAAYLVVPGIAAGYAVCAPGTIPRRLAKLIAAGVLMGAVSFAWIAYVEATPASQRPYVGGSTNNSEIGLTFGYNGFGRVGGETGGPGRVFVRLGGVAPFPANLDHTTTLRAQRTRAPASEPNPLLPNGHYQDPIAFGPARGPLRLLGVGFGDQAGWMLPFAALGLLALALSLLWRARITDPAKTPETAAAAAPEPTARTRSGRWERLRRDPRLAGLFVLGGWFATEIVVLSYSSGIVHPYYMSAIGPGCAAMVGGGIVALGQFARRRNWRVVLLPLAVVATVLVQIVLLHREHYMHAFIPFLIAGAAVGVVAPLLVRRLAAPAMVLTLAALLIAPTAYAATTWWVPVEGTFPAAGPRVATSEGRFGVTYHDMLVYRDLMRYIESHWPGTRWAVLTVSSNSSSPIIIKGYRAGALGGYSGTDPAVNGPKLARMVASHEARYVVLGGAYANRGGNQATRAVIRACHQIPSQNWLGSPRWGIYSLVLYDCAGHARALARS
jgi:4-amino-4-deoxy-L-arabinose transferase-like glycosyltransferase